MHFSDETWVDFVRGVKPAENMSEVEQHLTSHCHECETSLEFWKRITNFAAEERTCVVPQDLLHLVKTEFRYRQEEERNSPMIAFMVFDTAAQFLPAGLRSGSASTRQVVYEAEGLTVDMRFERHQQRNVVSAFGQLLDRGSPLTWLGNAAIVLWNNQGRMVSKTETNQCGEFHLEFPPQDQLRLSIITEGHRTMRIVLGNLE
jgi:hypothetical protein